MGVGVEWSLMYEVFFYMVMAACCALPSKLLQRAAILTWLAAILLGSWWGPRAFNVLEPNLLQAALLNVDLTFIAGIIAWWLRDLAKGRGPHLLAIGCAAFLSVYLSPIIWVLANLAIHMALAVGAACFVLVFASARASAMFAKDFPLVTYGNGSYGVFLIHVPIMTTLYALCGTTGWLTCVAAVAASLVLGTFFGSRVSVLRFCDARYRSSAWTPAWEDASDGEPVMTS